MPDPVYFPQINDNLILTQLPYQDVQAFETKVVDVESGMRFSFPFRGVGLTGYPTGPLGKFGINFSRITDAEVATLKAFHEDRRGRLKAFRFLDPGGNLVLYSEDFGNAYWDKSNGPVTVAGTTDDPFGGVRASNLHGAGTNAYLIGQVGPDDGFLSGKMMCASAWVRSPDVGAQLLIGFLDSTFGFLSYTNFTLVPNVWLRIHHNVVLWDDGYFRVILGGLAQWGAGREMDIFGVQVTPMKGEGVYVKTPGNYGYHERCRFDTDVFERKTAGPNENQVTLPVIEYFVGA